MARRRKVLYRPDVVRERTAAFAVQGARRVNVPLPDRLIDWARYPFQRRAFEALMRERLAGMPWLASAWADYRELQAATEALQLVSKKWPAPSAAAQVRAAGQRAAAAERRARTAEYLLAYYEALFPFLVELREDNAGEDSEPPDETFLSQNDAIIGQDAAARWLTEQEYRKLPEGKKYQLALDRYWSKGKTRWEVGRDYERYIGYTYEVEGYAVRYQGILEGFADFGRDLIATRDNEAQVVQCKYWSAQRTIHEKHIFQLLGTALAYRLENPDQSVSATLVTSTILSERAHQFAEQLGQLLPFKVVEGEKLAAYPCIKCNVSRRDGEKIYHLPFDQQYDAVLVEDERLECYVSSVSEAEALGFRRARRWLGDPVATR